MAHQKAITRPGTALYKAVRPDSPHLRLSDNEFAIAARQSLTLAVPGADNGLPAGRLPLVHNRCHQRPWAYRVTPGIRCRGTA